ncbi:serpin (serine protease inhibitor) domain-containing protein [Phthorimaea operculella]|nr:serpin (serine protease inhibitor) domain-containing protein [Phthorimaea operculella]
MNSKDTSSTICKFATKFCNEVDKRKSVVSSPLSAEYLLALVALGATEPSHSELLAALGFQDNDEIRSAFSSVSSKLRSLNSVTLNVANRVYVNEGPYQLEPGLLEDAKNVFDAAIEKIDFKQSKAAANTINQWVEQQTNHKIKDLFLDDSFNDDTQLVLVNAIYFKGKWHNPFLSRRTMQQDFHIDTKTTIKVPMMHNIDDYRYIESAALGAQLLEMPYLKNEASMLIILPNEIEGLNGVLQKLADGVDLMMTELKKMRRREVYVSLPKFKIETSLNLNELLPKIGIKSIFSKNNSGLGNMLSPSKSLYVSKVVQKAFIEVNEEGAEAAAATGMGICNCSAFQPPPPPRFMADRPFLAVIFVDNTALFMAAYRGA